jgi:hypothetical protein
VYYYEFNLCVKISADIAVNNNVTTLVNTVCDGEDNISNA